jgi:acetyl coenzyme A synthetase (ADP forming)-like protein
VIGASRKRGTIAAELFHNLVHFGFAGAVYPVNPTSSVVQSVRAYRSVLDIPDEVDLAVLVVPAAQVLAAVEECGRKGVRGLVLISAGFAEIGGAGAALQDKLVARLRHWGMRMVGPNCLGLLNADPAVSLDATFAPTFPPFGPVSFASQSGALGLAILDHAVALGIGISQFVSIGNKADVSAHDLIEYWEDDPATEVILLYLESLGDTRRFMRLARRVARKKPIVVVKSGRTAAGARAASSHTGSLAGADVAVDALLGQAGVIRTDTIEELFEVAMVLANQPVPRGRRVAVLTNAGGPGIMATDACESRRLEVARLAPDTEQALRAFLPVEASVKNPVDMIASATPESYEKALRILLADAGVDAVLVIFVTPIVTDPTEVAHAVRAASAGTEKTVVTCIMGTHGVPAAQAALRAAHVPSFAFPEAAARALAKAADYGAWLAQPAQSDAELLDITPSRAREALGVVDAPRWLEPDAVRTVLEAYGLADAAHRAVRHRRRGRRGRIARGLPAGGEAGLAQHHAQDRRGRRDPRRARRGGRARGLRHHRGAADGAGAARGDERRAAPGAGGGRRGAVRGLHAGSGLRSADRLRHRRRERGAVARHRVPRGAADRGRRLRHARSDPRHRAARRLPRRPRGGPRGHRRDPGARQPPGGRPARAPRARHQPAGGGPARRDRGGCAHRGGAGGLSLSSDTPRPVRLTATGGRPHEATMDPRAVERCR